MGKLKFIQEKIKAFVLMVGVIVTAVGLSILLGKYYLFIVKSYPVSKTVYRKVYIPVSIKNVRLRPVSLYTLQTGVYAERTGADELTGKLVEKGLRPFVSPFSPYKVLVFAAPTRERILDYKRFVDDDAFIVNEILNEKEIEVRSDQKYWLEFLPKFTDLFEQTLQAAAVSSSSKDNELANAWLAIADSLHKTAPKESSQYTEVLFQDANKLAALLLKQRMTLQEQAEISYAILKTKYDYEELTTRFAKF